MNVSIHARLPGILVARLLDTARVGLHLVPIIDNSDSSSADVGDVVSVCVLVFHDREAGTATSIPAYDRCAGEQAGGRCMRA